MYASTGVTFIPCFRNISIPHRRTIFLPAGSRVRSSFYRIRISPSKRSLFPVVTGIPKFLPKPSARSRAWRQVPIGKSSALTRLLPGHIFRDLSDVIITESFFHAQEGMLWNTVKMLDGASNWLQTAKKRYSYDFSFLYRFFILAPRVGLEPTTLRLTAECSTIELSRNTSGIFPWQLLL